MVRGWYQCCCGLNGFLRETFHLSFPLWQVEDGAGWKFLPVCLAPRLGGGAGFSEAFEALGLTGERRWMFAPSGQSPRDQNSPGHCMAGAFFFFGGVFGAATKCAMCYVAWFIIFLQATKLICSPIV